MSEQRENDNNPEKDKKEFQQGEKLQSEQGRKKASHIALVALVIIAISSFLPLLQTFTVPLILALTFTTILYPIFNISLKLTGNRRKLSSLLCCIFFFVVLLIPLLIIINLSIDELTSVISESERNLPQVIEESFTRLLENSSLAEALGITEIDLEQISEQIRSQLSGMVSFIISRTYTGVFGLLINALVLFFTMFYFFADGPRILAAIRQLLPISHQHEELIISRFTLISRATVTGTLIIGIAQGTAGGVILFLSGIQAWLLWAFVMVILSIIPLVGAWLVLIPAAAIQLLMGNIWTGIGIFLSSTFIVSNIDNLLRPHVVGHGAKIHDLMIFLSTLGGLALYGVMGFIIGPTIAAFFLTVVEIYKMELRSQIESIKKT
ncbi:putative membrane protein [Chitinispirillum alkaliphilum]|nr:putative membrane protein [Chitinispirillum alkaliphilum]